ncbi:MAG: TIGR03663 family protein, partial [Chloroflexi bacterium]|nr:TIGR03663 family protein [Chloroflexota bacterium]
MLAGLTSRARARTLRLALGSKARAGSLRGAPASLTLAWRGAGWEKWAYAAILAVALGTRLWDLGGRSLHYDEILHAWYAWRFAEGLGYSHTPVTHGPFLFHAAAATFALVGSSDVTARLLPALFGTALVGLPYFLRKELGRYGALAAAVLLTVSPSMLYFSRFIRNDIFMAVWALSLLIVMWRYMERPRTALLIAWVVLWALAFTTKESSYLIAGSFGLFLLGAAAPPLWRWARGRARLSDMTPAGDLLIVLGTLSLPLLVPAAGLLQRFVGITLVNPDGNDPRIASGEIVRAAAETG